MKKYWPFIGIAFAVALGVALAPYLWWILAAALVAGSAWFGRAWLWTAFGVICLALLAYWPIWLWRRGDTADALFVVGGLIVWALWNPVAQCITAALAVRPRDAVESQPPPPPASGSADARV